MGRTTPARLLARATVVGGLAVAPLLVPLTAGADGDTLANQLHRLRVCESSNRYHLNTGNGYYGAYQFDERTWRGLGMKGYPHKADKATQSGAARKLHNKRGWKPWPACARKEHLH